MTSAITDRLLRGLLPVPADQLTPARVLTLAELIVLRLKSEHHPEWDIAVDHLAEALHELRRGLRL